MIRSRLFLWGSAGIITATMLIIGIAIPGVLRVQERVLYGLPTLETIDSPELRPFQAGRIDFDPVQFDVDNGILVFGFQTSFEDEISYFERVAAAASEEHWRVVESTPHTQIYSRLNQRSGSSDRVTLTYDPARHHVNFRLERVGNEAVR